MVTRRLLGACGALLLAMTWGCEGQKDAQGTRPTHEEPSPDAGVTPPPEEDGGTTTPPDAGTSTDAGDTTPDAGTGGGTDGGTNPGTDGGTDAGTDGGTVTPAQDPWPKEANVNYTQRFNLGRPQGVTVDDAYNIWLLDKNRVGVLRPGDTQPTWAENLGQAGKGYSSTVICGGTGGRAYVGYYAEELMEPERSSYDDPVYKQGDVDAVMLTPDGKVQLEEHLYKSFRRNKEANDGSLTWFPPNAGIHNSNDWKFDEDRAVFTCARVMRGRDRGEVYIGTNHGVTRIRGLNYNSHRHPVWFDAQGGQHIGYCKAVGIAQDGDVLIGNDWTFGIVTPNADLGVWDWMAPKELNPMKVESSYLSALNSIEEFDYWVAFQQTKDGKYYMGSSDYGLWEMTITSKGDRSQKGTKVKGLPTDAITSMASTDDGSLFIGTSGSGLWRMDAQKNLQRVANVPGNRVKQVIYDSSATPGMLYVLTDAGLTVLRGY